MSHPVPSPAPLPTVATHRRTRAAGRVLWALASAWPIALLIGAGTGARAAEVVDLGESIPDAKTIAEGLFPEQACEDLKKAGFKCMGFKPAVNYSLPGLSFRLGSAELPDLLKQQLDVFAAALRERHDRRTPVRLEGHADASGTPEANDELSQRRADAVKAYLVAKGVDPAILQPVGMGSRMPKLASDPLAPVNRRVEIGRAGQAARP